MIVRGVDALLLIPVTPDAIVPAVEEAADAGIPVVVFASDVNTDTYVTKLLTDSVLFGRVQGDWLMEQLELPGQHHRPQRHHRHFDQRLAPSGPAGSD